MKTTPPIKIAIKKGANIFCNQSNIAIFIKIIEENGNIISFSLAPKEEQISIINAENCTLIIESISRIYDNEFKDITNKIKIKNIGKLHFLILAIKKIITNIGNPSAIIKKIAGFIANRKNKLPQSITIGNNKSDFIGHLSALSYKAANKDANISLESFAKECASISIRLIDQNGNEYLEVKNAKYELNIKTNYTATADAFEIIKDATNKNPDTSYIIFDKFYDKYSSDFPEFDPILMETIGEEIPILKQIPTGEITDNWEIEKSKYKKMPFEIFFDDQRLTTKAIRYPYSQSKFSIIIPSKDKSSLLQQCILSITRANDANYEIIIVDNGSKEASTHELYQKYEENKTEKIKIIDAPIEFNFAKLCNIGSNHASGDILIFLNNDVEIIDSLWLDKISYYIEQPNIGAVGAKLKYPDKTLQHAGIYLGINQGCGHLYVNANENDEFINDAIKYNSLRSAVTGALLAISAANFSKCGGFDEYNFPITYNDVDLCLKMRELGLYNMIINDTEIIHYESQSRESDMSAHQISRRAKETKAFQEKWHHYLKHDPWLPQYVNHAKSKYSLK